MNHEKFIGIMLIAAIAMSYLAISGRPAAAQSCDDFRGKAKKLCTKYCEKLDCDSEIPRNQILRRLACKLIEHSFVKKTGSAPPCESGPCAGLGECPCDYNVVPKTTDCWSNAFFISQQGDGGFCDLLHDTGMPGVNAALEVGELNPSGMPDVQSCGVINFRFGSCDQGPDQFISNLTQDQVNACKCQIEQYANELAAVPITIMIGGMAASPPFICTGP
jgi:hypothetical protein